MSNFLYEKVNNLLSQLKQISKGLLIVAFLTVIFGALAVFLLVDENIKYIDFFESGWGFAVRFVTGFIVLFLTIFLIEQAVWPSKEGRRPLKSMVVSALKKVPNVLAVNIGLGIITFLVFLPVALFSYFGQTIIYGRDLYTLFNYYMLTLTILALVMIFYMISNFYFAVFFAVILDTPFFDAFSRSCDLLKKHKKPILIHMTVLLLVNNILLTPMVFFINEYAIFLPLLISVMIFNVFYLILFARLFIKLDSNLTFYSLLGFSGIIRNVIQNKMAAKIAGLGSF